MKRIGVVGGFGLGIAAALAAAGAFAPGAGTSGQQPTVNQAERATLAKQGQKPTQPQSNDLRALLGGGLGSAYTRQRRARPGWTNRHVQRMARKKRNQARHRQACRG